MLKINSQDLLKDRRIVQEIHRYQWMESQRLGHELTFDQAANDWFQKFSLEWVRHYMMPKPRRPRTTRFAKRRFIFKGSF